MIFKLFDNYAKDRIKFYLDGFDYVGSDYSFYAFLDWFEGLEYAEEGGAFYMRATMEGNWYYWPPLVKAGGALSRKSAAAALPKDCWFAFCTEDFVSEIGDEDEYEIFTQRDWSEYIYSSNHFISLQGKRYHAKRGHIKKFSALYSVEMRSLREDDANDIEEFETKWLQSHTFDGKLDESAKRENQTVKSWYRAAQNGETICDLLFANGNLVGVTIGEIMPSNNAVVMYEKADTDYEGVYSYLANKFAERHFSGCKYINRQEDMGLEGLRKSKLSYYPEFLLNKYILKPAKSKQCSLPKSQTIPRTEVIQEGCDSTHEYSFLQLTIDDYDTLMTFYESGIEKLDDKLFFLNYTPKELSGILKNGYVLGAFCKGRLVSTCAVDFDKTYGDILKRKCKDEGGGQYYELSGIMTDENHRKKGLAHEVSGRVIEFAKENLSPCTLCAVVQYNNAPSLSNLKKFGFEEKAQEQNGPYNFKYLTLKI